MVWVFTILLTVLVLFFFMLINRYRKVMERKQNEVLRNLILGQDTERERISRDLHDQIGAQLNAIALTIDSFKSKETINFELLQETKQDLWKSQQDIRNISHDLMASSLRRYGLTEAIRKMINRNSGHGFNLFLEENTNGEELSDAQMSHIYNICRELIFNTHKHSRAKNAYIRMVIIRELKKFRFSYRDDGLGSSDKNKDQNGIGISNIQTRVKMMNGRFDYSLDSGCKAEIEIDIE